MRLDKFLSQQLGISRNLVARELRAGLVTIDGEMVKTGATKITPEQEVAYDGNVLTQILGPRYFMLNNLLVMCVQRMILLTPPFFILLMSH